MWHASVAPMRLVLPDHTLDELAHDVLGGVGDATAGEWKEKPLAAFHLRRRLTVAEARQVGPVLDVRTKHEGWRRWQAMQRHLPPELRGGPIE